MAFIDVVVADIELESNGLGAGKYVFDLNPGAAYRTNKFNGQEELKLSATVAEGDSKGRVTFWEYPDPTSESKNGKSMAWSAQAIKKLQVALGVDALPGEDPATYFGRVANDSAGRFSGEIIEETFEKNGVKQTKTKFSVFKVGPAA
jgi:hypothetical protein